MVEGSWLASWISWWIIVVMVIAVLLGGAHAIKILAWPILWLLGVVSSRAGTVPAPTASGRPHIPPDVRIKVLERDGWRCVYCGRKEELQIDHIIPVSRGGATTEKNLEVLCGKCNRGKSNN